MKWIMKSSEARSYIKRAPINKMSSIRLPQLYLYQVLSINIHFMVLNDLFCCERIPKGWVFILWCINAALTVTGNKYLIIINNCQFRSLFPFWRKANYILMWAWAFYWTIGHIIYTFNKIQLVGYHQCCIFIGWATSRL